MDRIAGIFSPMVQKKSQISSHDNQPFPVLTIPTAVLGIFTAISIIERVYKLVQVSPEYRPINSPRYGLDIFQWGYFAAVILISVLISSALARGDGDGDDHELQTRLLSLPTSILMFFLASLTLISLVLNGFGMKLPFRFGSSVAGTIVNPAVFYIVEDVVAVDGSGRLEYRKAWNLRYENSLVFRKLIWMMSVVWMSAFYIFAGIFTALVFLLPRVAVYGVGWAGPFIPAGFLAVWTTFYVRSALKREEEEEAENRTSDSSNSHAGESLQSDERAPLLSSVSP